MENNHDKCKIIVSREVPTPLIENVEHFKYLGLRGSEQCLRIPATQKMKFV